MNRNGVRRLRSCMQQCSTCLIVDMPDQRASDSALEIARVRQGRRPLELGHQRKKGLAARGNQAFLNGWRATEGRDHSAAARSNRSTDPYA